MDSTGFGGFAAFVVFAVITGVFVFLAWSQAKIKREIEESRRRRERDELTALGQFPTGVPSVPPDVTAGTVPEITPGGTPAPHPHHPHPPVPGTTTPAPDPGGHSSGIDAGGHHSGGIDAGGGHSGH